MSQTVYSVAVILLGIANVVLAGIAYSQRARQLAGRTLGERQLALAARRNEMAAERVERLDQQVTLLRGIHHSIVGQRDEASDDGETVGVIDVGSTTVRMVVVRRRPGGGLKRIVDERAFLHLGAEVERDGRYGKSTLRDVAARVSALEHRAACTGVGRMAVVLTAPGRLGENPQDLVAAVERSARSTVLVLSAAEEAELAFLGAAQSAAPHQRLAVCDIGGGSTELAFGTAADGVERTYCFDTGALSLAERCLPDAGSADRDFQAARREAERQLHLDRIPRCDLLLATGGSAKAVAKLVGPVADAAALEQALALATRPPKRVRKRLPSERRRSLPAGVLLLSVVQSKLALPVTVSQAGMREGMIQRLLEPQAPGGHANVLAAQRTPPMPVGL
jgi:exopolyphosphatase / guanosine-5'-triphosphate,3'-diphosphate pyrophosphatase